MTPWDIFWLPVLGVFDSKIRQQNLLQFMKFLNYSHSSCIIFCAEMLKYLHLYRNIHKNDLKHFGISTF